MRLLLLTGGSGGIGQCAATAFADAGYAVVNLSRRPCPVAQVEHIACDLSQPGFLDGIRAQLAPRLAAADEIVLLHNAAHLVADTASNATDEALGAALTVQLLAPNALNRHVIPEMGRGSCILYVGSTLSEKAVPGAFSYVTAKHAVAGMMRATCQDLAGTGIHTVCICPGFTDTAMLRERMGQCAIEDAAAHSTSGRLVEPDEIAALLLFAARQPVLNGALLHANLGQIER